MPSAAAKDRRDAWDIALHESAHAVAARAMGLKTFVVTVSPGARTPYALISRDLDNAPLYHRLLRNLSGEAGEVFSGNRPSAAMMLTELALARRGAQRGDGSDDERAAKILVKEFEDDHRAAFAWRKAFLSAQRLFKTAEWFAATTTLANELVRAKTLVAEEVETILAPFDLAPGLAAEMAVTEIKPPQPVVERPSSSRYLELPMLARAARIGPQSFRKSDNSVEVVFATGAPVRRRDANGDEFDEVLDVIPEAVDLSRMIAGAVPLLRNHDDTTLQSVIGRVVEKSARIAGGVGTARVSLSTAAGDADNVVKITTGILRAVSIGYEIGEIRVERRADNPVPIFRITRWMPVELSVVPIPDDIGAIIRKREERAARRAAERKRAEKPTALYPCAITARERRL